MLAALYELTILWIVFRGFQRGFCLFGTGDSEYEHGGVPTVGERKQSFVHPLRGRGAGKTEELEKLGRMRRMKYQT